MVITSKEDILKNAKTIDDYLKNEKEPEHKFAKELIKRGFCFICIVRDNEYSFYPSRFMGYKENNYEKHERSTIKDGKETNVVISGIIGELLNANEIKEKKQLQEYEKCEERYQKYCEKIGIESLSNKRTITKNNIKKDGKRRKYWIFEW